jgi:hypothetical protein
VQNILKFLILILLSSCAHQVPVVKFYAEIPFPDCPEAVWKETVTNKSGLIKCEEWKKLRPYMVMIDPDGKKEMFNAWSKVCRNAGDKCNMQMNSVREILEQLDRVVEGVVKFQ